MGFRPLSSAVSQFLSLSTQLLRYWVFSASDFLFVNFLGSRLLRHSIPWPLKLSAVQPHKSPVHVSVNSKPGHRPAPRPTPRECFSKGEPPRHKESTKPRQLGPKNRAKTPPLWQLFEKNNSIKKAKHKIEIMKSSTEVLICSEILKQ